MTMATGKMVSAVLLRRYVELWLSESEALQLEMQEEVQEGSARGEIVQREGGVLAGQCFVEAVYKYLGCVVQWRCGEGSTVEEGGSVIVGEVRGEAGRLLQGRKVVEAVLGRCSGAATEAMKLCSRLRQSVAGDNRWRGEVQCSSSRHSVGLGAVEEWGGRVGGLSATSPGYIVTVYCSSSSRDDCSVGERVSRVREREGRTVQVEVLCECEEEAIQAAESTANIVSLYNLESRVVLSISKKVKDINPALLVKVSGEITEDNILDFATCNVDIISSSVFNQGYKCIDFSMNIVDTVLSTESAAIDKATVEMSPIVEATSHVNNNDNNNSIINNNDIIEIDLIELDVFDKEVSTTTTATTKKVDNTTSVVNNNNKVNNKRKLDEKTAKDTEVSITAVTPAVSKVTTITKVTTVSTKAIDNSTLQQKKPEEKVVTKTVVTPRAKFQPANKIQRLNNSNNNINKFSSNNNNNNNNRNYSSLYQQQQQQQSSSMNSLNSRMPGMPVSMSTPRAISLNNNMNNSQLALGDTDIFRSMSLQSFSANSNGNQLLLQQQPDDAFFRGDAPIRYGGSSTTGRTAMNNMNNDQRNNNNNNAMVLMNRSNPRFVICKGCNFQNPANGAPLCRRCRNML